MRITYKFTGIEDLYVSRRAFSHPINGHAYRVEFNKKTLQYWIKNDYNKKVVTEGVGKTYPQMLIDIKECFIELGIILPVDSRVRTKKEEAQPQPQ